MFIEEVIVEGFKSYATRTVIAGFDPHFNAITGLNGSGKSNILDAICFVLGISNLSQVCCLCALFVCVVGIVSGFDQICFDCSCVWDGLGSSGKSARAGVQAGPGGSDQGHGHCDLQ